MFLLYYLPVLVWAAVIFSFSAMPSTGIGEYSLRFFLERKGAHVFEYTVLSMLLFRMFVVHAPKRTLESSLLSAVVALLYAVSDEIHQLFVFGREGKIGDVLIDVFGIMIGFILAFWWHERRYRMSKVRRSVNKWSGSVVSPKTNKKKRSL